MPDGDVARAAVAYLRAQRDAIVRNEPLVRAGADESVHDMRVAVRRSRSTLRTFRPLFPGRAARRVRAELAWLGGVLGQVRDREVVAALVRRALADAPAGPVPEELQCRLAEELTTGTPAGLAGGLDGDRYAEVLDGLAGVLDRGPVMVEAGAVWQRVGAAVAAADRELATAGRAPVPGRDVALHEARKMVKRARYAVEAVRVVAGAPAAELVRRLTAVQELLGDHHDTVTVREYLRGRAARWGPVEAAGCAVLGAEQEAVARRLEGRLPELVAALSEPITREFLVGPRSKTFGGPVG